MAGPYPLPPARPGRDPADFVRWRFTTVLLAVLPLVSLGLLAVVTSAWLAIRRRTPRTRAVAVLVAAASVTEYVLIVVYPSPPGPPTWALSPLILLTWLGVTAHFLIELTLWRRDVLPPIGRPAPYPAAPGRTAWQPYPAGPHRPAWNGPVAPPGHVAPPGPVAPPGYAGPPAQPGPPVQAGPPAGPVPPAVPVPPAHLAPPPVHLGPPVPPAPSGIAVPQAVAPAREPLDDDTIGVDLGAELRLLGAEFGRDAGASGAGASGAGRSGAGGAAADGSRDDGARRPGPGGAR